MDRREVSVPPPVNNLHVMRTSMTVARIGWEPPNFEACDSLRGYQVYLSQFEQTVALELN